MKKDVEDLHPIDRENLIQTIFRTWDNISQEIINNLIDFMPSRLREVQAENGRQTRY